MNSAELIELGELQSQERMGTLSPEGSNRLRELREKLAVTETEVKDDPTTLFTDETRSPNLSDDKDFKAEQFKRDVQETVKDVKTGVNLFVWFLQLLRSFRK